MAPQTTEYAMVKFPIIGEPVIVGLGTSPTMAWGSAEMAEGLDFRAYPEQYELREITTLRAARAMRGDRRWGGD